jgi:ATP-binding cassette, subfamily B, bacterial MsbA
MKSFLWVARYLKKYWNYLILNIGFNILAVLFSVVSLTMVIPFLGLLFGTQPLVHEKPEVSFNAESAVDYFYYLLSKVITGYGPVEALMLICILVIILFLFKNLFLYFAMFFVAPIRNGVVRDLRNEIYNKILILPLSYYSEERKGDIISRMTGDVQEIEWAILSSLEAVFREPVAIIFFLATLFFLNAEFTLLILIMLPLTGLLIGRIGKSLKRASDDGQKKMGVLLSVIEETLSGLRVIKAFTAEKFADDRFREMNERYSKVMIKMYRKRDLASPLSEFMGAVVLVILMWLGGRMVLGEATVSMSPSVFIGFIAVFSQLIRPAKAFTSAYYNVQKGIASAERVRYVIDAAVTIKDNADAIDKKEFTHSIRFDNVNFSYGNRQVLFDVDFEIEKGKTVALVGASGAGKSTVADLLARFYDSPGNDVLIDDVSVKKIKSGDLRKLMGIVPQETILFNDTVFNNIAFGKEDATEDAVIHAAKIANAHEFIVKLPQGYQTNIGDRGSKLSGGQRQRLSIARAVLKNPPILILDEATSALDTESERLVQDAILHLMENRTSLVIAHRLSTIQHADEIIVMSEGRIIERGRHEQLIDESGVYKKLYELQAFA